MVWIGCAYLMEPSYYFRESIWMCCVLFVVGTGTTRYRPCLRGIGSTGFVRLCRFSFVVDPKIVRALSIQAKICVTSSSKSLVCLNFAEPPICKNYTSQKKSLEENHPQPTLFPTYQILVFKITHHGSQEEGK